MLTRVVVLNGGSSSGKSTIARRLQTALPEPWLSLSVDTLVDAMPPGVLDITDGGEVRPDDAFGRLELAWMAGVAAMAAAGAEIVVDDVFLGGRASQDRWRRALDGLGVLWVGVRCAAETAAARERTRADRAPGMAARQAETVHEGVVYDLEVDTTHTTSEACADVIRRRIT